MCDSIISETVKSFRENERDCKMNKTDATYKALIEEFVLVNKPDATRVAVIIKQAIGPDRSNKAFAELIGVNEVALSRMRNGKITKSMGVDTIIKVFENQATPPDGEFPVDVFELLEANGYVSKAMQQKNVAAKELKKSRLSAFRAERELMSMIIKTALFDRGIELRQSDLEYTRGQVDTVIGNSQRCDFATAMGFDGEHYIGVFFTIPQKYEDFNFDGNQTPAEDIMRQLMNELSSIFLTDAWDQDYYEQLKIHFCFVDKLFYEIFVDKIESANLHNRFSAVLLDDEKLCVVEETSFEAMDHEGRNSNFFDRPVVRGISFEDDDVASEITGMNFLISATDDDDEE